MPSISDKKSHFASDVPEAKAWLADLLDVRFEGNVAMADRMWLRKEIMKTDLDRASRA